MDVGLPLNFHFKSTGFFEFWSKVEVVNYGTLIMLEIH